MLWRNRVKNHFVLIVLVLIHGTHANATMRSATDKLCKTLFGVPQDTRAPRFLNQEVQGIPGTDAWGNKVIFVESDAGEFFHQVFDARTQIELHRPRFGMVSPFMAMFGKFQPATNGYLLDDGRLVIQEHEWVDGWLKTWWKVSASRPESHDADMDKKSPTAF